MKNGKYVYVGDKKGDEALVEAGKTEVVDYTGKGLVMSGCGNGHAHYSIGYGIQSVGTIIDREASVEKFLTEIVPAAVKKARDTVATIIFGKGWNVMEFPKNMRLPVSSGTLYAVIFLCTLWMKKTIRN